MPIQPPDKTIEEWSDLFRRVNGMRAPPMAYSRGWFSVSGRRAVREEVVLMWTDNLHRRAVTDAGLPTPEDVRGLSNDREGAG